MLRDLFFFQRNVVLHSFDVVKKRCPVEKESYVLENVIVVENSNNVD